VLEDGVVKASVTTVITYVAALWFSKAAFYANAATISAASTSYSDVAAAVSSARHGDIVRLPAGQSEWTTMLRVTTSIQILGAGADSTIIVSPGNSILRFASMATNYPVRVSGIFFSNQAHSNPSLTLHGKIGGGDVGAPIRNFRIDHCKFYGGNRAVTPYGWTYGVIDHCTFTNCAVAVGHIGDSNDAWKRPLGIGTMDCVVIEDCAFLLPPDYHRATQCYNEQGARVTVRHSRFVGSTGDPAFLECHGNQNYYTGDDVDYRSAVFVEAYHNTFEIAINNYRYLNFRGGSLLIYSNNFTDASGRTPLLRLTEEEGWAGHFFSPLRTTWPAQDQITNSFFWGNKLNGVAVSNPVEFPHPESDPVFLREGRDYWLEPPSTSNGRPAGVYGNYRPLVYPHPLVSGFQKPDPPANFRVGTSAQTASSPE
jgi:hypothetical protein